MRIVSLPLYSQRCRADVDYDERRRRHYVHVTIDVIVDVMLEYDQLRVYWSLIDSEGTQ